MQCVLSTLQYHTSCDTQRPPKHVMVPALCNHIVSVHSALQYVNSEEPCNLSYVRSAMQCVVCTLLCYVVGAHCGQYATRLQYITCTRDSSVYYPAEHPATYYEHCRVTPV
jgi:disulfide bond formation protein DsbB